MPGRDKVSPLHPGYIEQRDAHLERQKRRKKRLMRRLVLFFTVVMIAVGTMVAYHLKQREVQAEKKQEYEKKQEELSSLEQEERQLSDEIDLLNDDEYVLDIARTNYFFSKEGELIFKLPDEEPSY